MKYDVVIIGSGLGGLACGSLLAEAGLRVCILERSNQLGGCLQSYRREGLDYDTGLHYVGGLDEGGSLHEAFRRLHLLELPWQRMDGCFDHVLLGDRHYALAQGFDRFTATLSRDFPHQQEQLQRFADRIHRASMEDMEVSAWDYLHECFQDEELIQVLGATAMRVGLHRESLPLFCLAHALSSYIESSWRLRGSGNQIVERLARTIREGGGELRCRHEVTGLRIADGRVEAVTCSNGATIEAENIICDAHPELLARLLEGQPVRRSYLQRIRSGENTFGIFTLSLRLRPGVIPYFNHNAYVFRRGSDVWQPEECGEEATAVMLSCRVPEDDSPFARQVDLLSPMSWSTCQPWEATTVGHRGPDYERLCHTRSESCLHLAERYLPGLSAAVERSYTSSPLTYRDYLAAPQGSAFGLRKDWRRPLQTFLSVRTPLPNLFLTGQSLVLPGIEGTTQTALQTCSAILGETNNNKIQQ